MQKDHKRNTSSMQESRQKIIQEKYDTLKTVLEDMIHNEEEVTVARVCELSGLSKRLKSYSMKQKLWMRKEPTISIYRQKLMVN